MSRRKASPYFQFRLNLEQQKKRAKELLKSAIAEESIALSRFNTLPLKLSSAQRIIASELRFKNWAALKMHIESMDSVLDDIINRASVLDADCKTMHIRCGNDIQNTLKEAGFHGDFNLHINPYCQGPVTDTDDYLERRARFIVEYAGWFQELTYEGVLQGCRDEETRLQQAITDYDRVVLWLEHDGYDQFTLIRCLAWFAEYGMPPILELVSLNDFPGSIPFLGLGQLPPEALRLLWKNRQSLNKYHLRMGLDAWDAFRNPDPTRLCEIASQNNALLPYLPNALVRHLKELPSLNNGLSFTQYLLLKIIAKEEIIEMRKLLGMMTYNYDPLPTFGHEGYNNILRQMELIKRPLIERIKKSSSQDFKLDQISITKLGKEVLGGNEDFMNLNPLERWVGGVLIKPGKEHWRWDDSGNSVKYIN